MPSTIPVYECDRHIDFSVLCSYYYKLESVIAQRVLCKLARRRLPFGSSMIGLSLESGGAVNTTVPYK